MPPVSPSATPARSSTPAPPAARLRLVAVVVTRDRRDQLAVTLGALLAVPPEVLMGALLQSFVQAAWAPLLGAVMLRRGFPQ